jgi:8-oxo-dGTP pyrophosphatase MutT (NUDIX family)
LSTYLRNLRKQIGHERILVPSTACIIIDEKGEILLQQRADTGDWGCPGGLMDLNETVIESLQREVFEETGLSISSPQLLGIYSGVNYNATYPNGDQTQSVLMVFYTDIFSGSIKSDQESLNLKFFSSEYFPKNLNPHHSEYLGDYIKFLKEQNAVPIVH